MICRQKFNMMMRDLVLRSVSIWQHCNIHHKRAFGVREAFNKAKFTASASEDRYIVLQPHVSSILCEQQC